MWVVETERLQLRQLTGADEDALYAVFSDPITMRLFPKPFSREEVRRFIARNEQSQAEAGHSLFAMVRRDTGEVIGDCGLWLQQVEGTEETELGYHLRRDQWGQGFAAEAARACVEYGFRERGLQRIVSLILPANTASQKVAARAGLRPEREVDHRGLRHLLYVVRSSGHGRAQL